MSRQQLAIPVKVTSVKNLTPMIREFRFEALAGGELPYFSGGAHITVEMHDGDAVRRNSYSLVSPPGVTDHYSIAVRKDEAGRGGSRYMHEEVLPDSQLTIYPPVNLFGLVQRARKHLYIAGGVGITPIWSMIRQLTGSMEQVAPFELHYACRSREHAAYAEAISAVCGRRARFHFSAEGDRLNVADVLANQPLGTHVYVCGPESLIADVMAEARRLGWPEASLHQEHFSAPLIGAPYQVTLARSDIKVSVAGDQSLLDAIEDAGVSPPYMCRGGACGQCETKVLSSDGTILHADHFLSAEDKASGLKIMPCVSRFEGKELVLDL